MFIEVLIIIFYFVLVIGIGVVFSKTAAESTSSYFRGVVKCSGGWWVLLYL